VAADPRSDSPVAPAVSYEPVAFSDLAGWTTSDPRPALWAFQTSCSSLGGEAPPEIVAAGERARGLDPKNIGATAARGFFEAMFEPHRVVHAGPAGFVTGYYETVLEGSRTPTADFRVPIYRRPPDLVSLVDEALRGTVGDALTHVRRSPGGDLLPFATRAEIEQGALAGRDLELLYLADPVDTFFLHIQGSGLIRLANGRHVRVTYDGKNGHPYTSVGRNLIETGVMTADEMSLATLGAWLKADPERGRRQMWRNRSFVFFRELEGDEAGAPVGVRGIPLTPGVSLAVDTGIHAIGLPVWVSSPTLTHADDTGQGFHRLMVAQDTGSAIRGPERGDIFFGSGPEAGQKAGITKHAASFRVLLPRGGTR
jgi:membrane-bound lytic murein transglycosylase A